MTRMIITILLALLIPIPGFGQDVDTQGNSPREYVIPGHGVLELTVPQSWRDEVRQPPEGLPPTIVFELESGDEFSLLISVIWSPTQEEGFNSAEKIQPLVEYGRNMMLPTAVEEELVLEKIQGRSGAGYFFSATDKSLVGEGQEPKPGDYEYATQGILGVGDLLLSFTFLTHQQDSEAMRDALSMLREASQRLENESPDPSLVLDQA